jgi:hypothetical protein
MIVLTGIYGMIIYKLKPRSPRSVVLHYKVKLFSRASCGQPKWISCCRCLRKCLRSYHPLLSISECAGITSCKSICIYTYLVQNNTRLLRKFFSFSTTIYIENLYVYASNRTILLRIPSKIPKAILPCPPHTHTHKRARARAHTHTHTHTHTQTHTFNCKSVLSSNVTSKAKKYNKEIIGEQIFVIKSKVFGLQSTVNDEERRDWPAICNDLVQTVDEKL